MKLILSILFLIFNTITGSADTISINVAYTVQESISINIIYSELKYASIKLMNIQNIPEIKVLCSNDCNINLIENNKISTLSYPYELTDFKNSNYTLIVTPSI